MVFLGGGGLGGEELVEIRLMIEILHYTQSKEDKGV